MMHDKRLTWDGQALRAIPLDFGHDARGMQGCWVIRFNGEGVQLKGLSQGCTALMGMMGA